MKTTVRKSNPCKECGSTAFTATFDSEYCPDDNPNPKPMWECNCCTSKTFRQVRVSAKQKQIDKLLGF